MDENEGAAKAVDDRGTSQTRDASAEKPRDTGFEVSDEKLALLGTNVEDVQMVSGESRWMTSR